MESPLVNTRHIPSCMCVGFLRSSQLLDFGKLLGIRGVAAFLQLELFRVKTDLLPPAEYPLNNNHSVRESY
jgi:hypothetical protein